VLKGLNSARYESVEGAGDVYIDDCAPETMKFSKGQRVWGRQFNTEHVTYFEQKTPMVDISGAVVWILGQKTEGGKTILKVHNGGIIEMLGGSFYRVTGDTKGIPLFQVENDGSLFAAGYFTPHSQWPVQVRETRNGITKELPGVYHQSTAAYTAWNEPLNLPLTNSLDRSSAIEGFQVGPVREPSTMIHQKGYFLTHQPSHVYDLTGRRIVSQRNDAYTYRDLISKPAYGIYIVQPSKQD